MALSVAKLTALKKKQEKEVIIPEGTIDFLAKIELSSQSKPYSGVLRPLGKTKTGNYRYAFTCSEGNIKFFAKEELTVDHLEEHSFGIQEITDEKTGAKVKLYWY